MKNYVILSSVLGSSFFNGSWLVYSKGLNQNRVVGSVVEKKNPAVQDVAKHEKLRISFWRSLGN